jgi:putative transposase
MLWTSARASVCCVGPTVFSKIRTFKSADVVKRLEALVGKRGRAPSRLRSDNGSEFVAAACEAWLKRNSVEHVRSRPGKPTDNPMVESFNSRLRDECLDRQLFATLKDASTATEAYRREYNEVRPHSALKYQTPVEYRQSLQRRPAGLS